MAQKKSQQLIPIHRALLSISDKSGLIELAQALTKQGIDLLSTGGSATTIRSANIAVENVENITGFPEILDGRVKTLHPHIHAGLLALRNCSNHNDTLIKHNIAPIDLLVVNLYPFALIQSQNTTRAECIENIDIGGPALIRAAAKNYRFVTVIVTPNDYQLLINHMQANDGKTTLSFRQKMAQKAYAYTAAYDSAIAAWMDKTFTCDAKPPLAISAPLLKSLRYGENPHQSAWLYQDHTESIGAVTAQQHSGKTLSYNNIIDADVAFELISEFDPKQTAAVAIIKHGNPCGVACHNDLSLAYKAAYNCDPLSAFGGVVALNQPIDVNTAQKIIQIFTEVVIAPAINKQAISILAQQKNLRLLTTGGLIKLYQQDKICRQVFGGYIIQTRDRQPFKHDTLKIVSQRTPNKQQMQDLIFAWHVAKHSKSNAIVCAKNNASIGIGVGQTSRIEAVQSAVRKASDMQNRLNLAEIPTHNAVVASDGFFPFTDSVIEISKAGASAIIQPGGSIRDAKIIKVANDAKLTMVFTNRRHFRH